MPGAAKDLELRGNSHGAGGKRAFPMKLSIYHVTQWSYSQVKHTLVFTQETFKARWLW